MIRRILMLAGFALWLVAPMALAEDEPATPPAPSGMKSLPGAVKSDVGKAAREEMDDAMGKVPGASAKKPVAKDRDADDDGSDDGGDDDDGGDEAGGW
jgi:hypothetical protein